MKPDIMRMRLIIFTILLLAGVSGSGQSLEQGFRHPPASAKPWVFWYWMNAAVSQQGVKADLVAMKQAGIGGAYLMPINDVTNPPLYTPVVRQLSPEWWSMVRYAMQIADSLGLQLAMHDCDGFAVAGGPWITPELSMQKVVWSQAICDGGQRVDIRLPQPPSLENYYKDIAVLAFPDKVSWDQSTRDLVPVVTTSTGTDASFLVKQESKESFKSDVPCWIQYSFDRPFTCRTIVIYSTNNYESQRLMVEASDDGVHFRSVEQLTPPRHGWQDGDAPVTHTIDAVTSRYFRFVYNKVGSEPGAEDLDAAKWTPNLKLNGITLSSRPAIEGFEGKSGAVWRVSPPSRRSVLSDSLCIPADAVIDITDKMDTAGHLVWQAPAGHWSILRLGHTSTGHTNATGGGGKGLECDKFNPEAVRLQFDRWFGEAVRQVGPDLAGRVLKIFHVDSWECGSQNWSPVFAAAFKARRGYDLLRWLPAMAGVPIGSARSTEKFLHDIRQTIAELLCDNFYQTMADLAHAKGCSFSAESVAPTMTSDGMMHYRVADIPMGEFWLRSPTHDKPNDILDAVSGGHIYGKPIIQAEAFTELREAWDEDPDMLKPLQDRNYALGINRMVFHVFMHNPWMDRKPGMTLGGVGTFLQRDQTWWGAAAGWISYTQRCQWLLQQGHPVVDIGVFSGEELPRRSLLPERLVSTLPGLFGADRVASERVRLQNSGTPTTKFPNGVSHMANMTDPADWIDPLHGYAFDSFNPDALLRLASVSHGRVVFPGGASYGVLVMPSYYPLSPNAGAVSAPVAGKLAELEAAGAKVIRMPWTAASLDSLGIARDFAVEPGTRGIAYTHRAGEGWALYFVSNQADTAQNFSVSLRVSGLAPELWDAVTGEIAEARGWRELHGRTIMRLGLAAHGSIFIVFRKAASPPMQDREWLTTVEKKFKGGWTVRFDTAMGGAAGPVRFDSLTDWSTNADSAIRYYSGTAVYTQSFTWARKPSGRVWLDLGVVKNVAAIQINGVDCGTLWTAPYRVDITRALRAGKNTMQIAVTNTWANRIIGDQRLPELKRLTWTTAAYHLDGKLQPAGLLGEVRIVQMP